MTADIESGSVGDLVTSLVGNERSEDATPGRRCSSYVVVLLACMWERWEVKLLRLSLVSLAANEKSGSCTNDNDMAMMTALQKNDDCQQNHDNPEDDSSDCFGAHVWLPKAEFARKQGCGLLGHGRAWSSIINYNVLEMNTTQLH